MNGNFFFVAPKTLWTSDGWKLFSVENFIIKGIVTFDSLELLNKFTTQQNIKFLASQAPIHRGVGQKIHQKMVTHAAGSMRRHCLNA
jgi:hypothetical protein